MNLRFSLVYWVCIIFFFGLGFFVCRCYIHKIEKYPILNEFLARDRVPIISNKRIKSHFFREGRQKCAHILPLVEAPKALGLWCVALHILVRF
jgi:hypothetical protein